MPGATLLLLLAASARAAASAPDPGSGPTFFHVDVEQVNADPSEVDHLDVEEL